MTITAKFPGKCAACGGQINPGDRIEWENGQKARHAECPTSGAILNAAYQPKGETARTNRKSEPCTFCGTMLQPGQGNLWWGEDGCCSNPRHFDDGGWHVTCFDREACQARAQAASTKALEAKRMREEQRATAQATIDAVLAMTSPVESAPAWATPETVAATWARPAMVHTGAYQSLYLTEAECYYHVPGYFACDWDYPAVHRAGAITPEQHAQILEAIQVGKEANLIA